MTVGLFESSRLIKARILRRHFGLWGWHMLGWILLGAGWVAVERVFGLPIILFSCWLWLVRKQGKSLLFLFLTWMIWGWFLAVAYATSWWLAHFCLGILWWVSLIRNDFPALPVWLDWLALILTLLIFVNLNITQISLIGFTYHFIVLIWVFWCDWWLRQRTGKYGQ